MPTEVQEKLVEVLPSVLWFLLALVAILIFQKPIRKELLPNLTALSAGGLELSFNAREALNQALQLAEKHSNWKVHVTEEEKQIAIARARRHRNLLRGSHILWVDDVPGQNVNEMRMFQQLKVKIDTAEDTDSALPMLMTNHYDIVFSDIARGDNNTAGLEMLTRIQNAVPNHPPVIFYVGVPAPDKGVPPYAFGITVRPDELLHLALDVLERKRSA